MNDDRIKGALWHNLNRLVIIATIFLALRLFTYFFKDFLPVFWKVCGLFFSAFLPFLLALLIAFLLEPVVTRLMQVLHLRRVYASLLALVLTFAVFGLLIFAITSRLYAELADLAVNLPDYQVVINIVTAQIASLQNLFSVHPQLQSALFSAAEEIFKSLQGWAKAASVVLLNVISALPGVFVVAVVSVVAALLISASFPQVKRALSGFFPKRWQNSAHVVGQDLGAAVVGFLRAEFILVSITALGVTLGLLLMKNPYAVTMGILAGILDIIPILGPGLLFVPWVIILLVLGKASEGIKILVLYLVVTAIRQVLEPKIMAQSIGLNPLLTLLSMYVGMQLLGMVGLILGPALLILLEAMQKAGVFKRRA